MLAMRTLSELRQDTPGCQHVTHFNNAGAALMPRPVIEAQKRQIDREGAIGGYEAEWEAAPALGRVYDEVATLLNAHRDEIALVDSATRAWDMMTQSACAMCSAEEARRTMSSARSPLR